MHHQLADLIRLSHLKFRTRPSSDSQTVTINLRSPVSPYQATLASSQLPTIELDQKETLNKLDTLLRCYGLPLNTTKIRTSGDEMELYANIIRHYRTLFVRQEKEWPTRDYDSSSTSSTTGKRKTPEYLLIKSSSWLDFLTLQPERNAEYEREYTRCMKGDKHDELLWRITTLIHIHQADHAANILKQYLLALKIKQNVKPKATVDNSTNNAVQGTSISDLFWKNIFDVNVSDEPNNDDDQSDNDEGKHTTH
jgi:hypothetical protein